ncbi:MAG TPA: OB-fold nucleic acid binding domain-containing protein, partial [Methylomirabilota bacterium]|nr:OB-fold nucleic acid binding domain-containing protein [Methylomirabilota bacterium]
WESGGAPGPAHVSYATVSRRLAEDVQHLLVRLGIVARLDARPRREGDRRVVELAVTVGGPAALQAFARTVARRFLDPGAPDRVRALARAAVAPRPSRASRSDLSWDRVTAVEPAGVQETYDLRVEGDHNFLANDVVVHNSHASSFALLAYASAFLKVHHPAPFYAALLNNQPMGFYHAATIVKDAQRHGLRIRPVDVTRSDWDCTLEPADDPRAERRWTVRLGLRYVTGLRAAAGRGLVAARAARPFASVRDVAARAGLARDEMQTLAAIGAFAALGVTRRDALWAAAVPAPGPLFAAAAAPPAPAASPLAPMTETERLAADYAGTGVTLGRHPMALRRTALARRGAVRAADLARRPAGRTVRVAGSVIVRQRPGTAKGFVFLSLEDETGIANVVVTPALFARRRLVLVTAPFVLVEGILQRQDGVVSVRARRVEALERLAHVVPSHDFG